MPWIGALPSEAEGYGGRFFIPLDMPCRSPRAHFARAYGRRTERPPGRNPVSNEASVEASVRMSCAKKCVTTAPRKGDIAGAAAVYPRRFRRQTRPAICGILVRGFWTNTEPSPKGGLVPQGLRHAPGCPDSLTAPGRGRTAAACRIPSDGFGCPVCVRLAFFGKTVYDKVVILCRLWVRRPVERNDQA